jgi:hypothetical protein
LRLDTEAGSINPNPDTHCGGRIAALTQAAFLKELGARHIPIHYGMDELAENLKVISSQPFDHSETKAKVSGLAGRLLAIAGGRARHKSGAQKNVTIKPRYPHSKVPAGL